MTSLPEATAGAPTTAPVSSPSTPLRLAAGGPPLSPRRARTRQRLMAAAVEVFAERGVIGSSVEVICEAAGFTRGAFYSNFADKDALVLALIEQAVTEEYAAAERAVADLKAQDPGLPPTEAVSLVLSRLNLGGSSDRTTLLAQQELLLYAARVPELRAPYQAFDDACRAQVHALVVDALEYAGLEFTMPVETALDLLMGAHDHMHRQALFTSRLDPTAMHALILGLTRPRRDGAVRPQQEFV